MLEDDSESGSELPIPQVLSENKLLITLVSALLLVFTIVFLPEVQALLYFVLVASPSTVQWGIVSLIIFSVGMYKQSDVLLVTAVVVFIGLGVIVGPFVGNIQAHEEQADMIESQDPQIEQLPDTPQDKVRVLPRGVSDTYAESSMQKPQYRLTQSDIAYQDGKYQWSHGVVPDNVFVQFQKKQFGSLYIDMEQTSKDVTIEEKQFQNGRNQLWFSSYEYKSVLSNPTAQHQWETTFNAKDYIAHSTVTHEWKFRFLPIPQFYAIPQHNTVDVMNQDGTVEKLTLKEAQDSERLEKQNFYPYDVAMFKVNSMRYRNGVMNLWTSKEDVFEIATMPASSQNDWPLTVPVNKGDSFGLTYFIGAEAINSGSGLYQVWTVDGQTGKTEYIEYDQNQIGPTRAVDFVSNKQQVNELSDATPVSPIPVMSNNQLYWHVKVVPQSESGIIYTAFVNTNTGDVTLLEGTEPIYQFMTQDEVEEVKETTNSTGSENTTTVTVAVTDESGNIIRTEEVSVPEGGEANINVKNNNSEDE